MKKLIFLCMTIGSIIGGYIPTFWGVSNISFSSIILSACGGLAGIWVGYTLAKNFE